jgi:predicted Holliday junction resolvase-like endonuclease
MFTEKTTAEIKAWHELKPVLFHRDPEMRYEKRDGRFVGIIIALIVLWSLILIMLLMRWGPFKMAL